MSTAKKASTDSTVAELESGSESGNEATVVSFPTGEKVATSADPSEHIKQLRASADANKGKGLKVMSEGRSDIYQLNPYSLKVKPGFNCRDFTIEENMEHVRSLAISIAEIGVSEPLTVYIDPEDRELYIIDGECRWRATLYAIEELGAEIRAIPAKNEHKGTSEADRVCSQIIRNGGKPFTVMETATNFIKLVRFGYTEANIAARTGYTVSRVKQIIDVLEKTPDEIKGMIQRGEISAGLAQQTLAAAATPKAATSALKKAVSKAHSEGRKKATARMVTGAVGAKLSPIKTIARLLGEAKVSRRGEVCTITIPVADYDSILIAAGMSKAS